MIQVAFTLINGPWLLTVWWFLRTWEPDPLGVSMVSISLLWPALIPIRPWLLSIPLTSSPTWFSQPWLSPNPDPHTDQSAPTGTHRVSTTARKRGYFFTYTLSPADPSSFRRTDVTQIWGQSLWLPHNNILPLQTRTEQYYSLPKYHTVSNQHTARHQTGHN